MVLYFARSRSGRYAEKNWCYFRMLTDVDMLLMFNKKLSYRLQTVRCWFVKFLRYGRTFCQNT